MSGDILSVIQTNMSTSLRGQKLVTGFILESYDKAAFITANRLGKTVNVSGSTVMRLAAELGYDGHPAMQKALQEMIRSKLTPIQRTEISNDRIGNQDILSMVMQSGIDRTHMTLKETNREDFDRAISAIVDARHICILGVRFTAALVSFLGFYFDLIFDNITAVHATSTNEIFEQLLRIGPNDVIMGVNFPRYSRRTMRAIQFAHNRGAATIALTDSETSPSAPISTLALLAKSNMASFVDSLVAPLSLINTLVMATGRKKNDNLSQTFEAPEQVWDKYEVYEKVEEIT